MKAFVRRSRKVGSILKKLSKQDASLIYPFQHTIKFATKKLRRKLCQPVINSCAIESSKIQVTGLVQKTLSQIHVGLIKLYYERKPHDAMVGSQSS